MSAHPRFAPCGIVAHQTLCDIVTTILYAIRVLQELSMSQNQKGTFSTCFTQACQVFHPIATNFFPKVPNLRRVQVPIYFIYNK